MSVDYQVLATRFKVREHLEKTEGPVKVEEHCAKVDADAVALAQQLSGQTLPNDGSNGTLLAELLAFLASPGGQAFIMAIIQLIEGG